MTVGDQLPGPVAGRVGAPAVAFTMVAAQVRFHGSFPKSAAAMMPSTTPKSTMPMMVFCIAFYNRSSLSPFSMRARAASAWLIVTPVRVFT